MKIFTKVECCIVFALFSIVLVCQVQGSATKCVPGLVENVTFYSNYSVYWSEVENPYNCTINNYVLDVVDLEDGTELQFTTYKGVLNYDLSFLDMCKAYSFEVHALTDKFVLGPADSFAYTTAPTAKVNLNITLHKAKVNSDQITISWDLAAAEVTRCVSYYRVVYWNENNDPKDVYVTKTNFSLTGDVPCMKYEFQVNAVIGNPDIEGPFSEVATIGYASAPSPPRLQTLVTTNHSVNMTWQIESYSDNRCKIESLSVVTLGAPSNISELSYRIHDSPLRPDVTVYIDGLSPDTVYFSQVAVVNSAGSSKNVSITFQTSDTFLFDPEVHLLVQAEPVEGKLDVGSEELSTLTRINDLLRFIKEDAEDDDFDYSYSV